LAKKEKYCGESRQFRREPANISAVSIADLGYFGFFGNEK